MSTATRGESDDAAAEPIVVRGSRRSYAVTFVASASRALEVTAARHHYAVFDSQVAALWPELLAPFSPERVVRLNSSESTKSLEGVESLLADLIANGFSRSDTLVVIGGGVTQDVASFAASVLYRGALSVRVT